MNLLVHTSLWAFTASRSIQYDSALRMHGVLCTIAYGTDYQILSQFPLTLRSGVCIRVARIPHPCQCVVLHSYYLLSPLCVKYFFIVVSNVFWCLESQLATHWKTVFCCKRCEQWRRMCSVRPVDDRAESWLLWPGLLPLCLRKDWFLFEIWQRSKKKSPHSIVLTSHYSCLGIWDYLWANVRTNPFLNGKASAEKCEGWL